MWILNGHANEKPYLCFICNLTHLMLKTFYQLILAYTFTKSLEGSWKYLVNGSKIRDNRDESLDQGLQGVNGDKN